MTNDCCRKVMKVLLGGLLALLLTGAQAATKYLEGVEYTRVSPQPVETGSKIEVREIFWYGCPHCYTLEPTLTKWIKTMPANAGFVRMPAVLNPSWAEHARAYYTFEALGAVDKLHGPMFDAMHKDGRSLNDLDSIAGFSAELGVDAEKFRGAYKSFGVDAKVKAARQLGQRYGLTAVPAIVVDGKYMTNGTLAGGYDSMMKVVEHLIKKSAEERSSGAKK